MLVATDYFAEILLASSYCLEFILAGPDFVKLIILVYVIVSLLNTNALCYEFTQVQFIGSGNVEIESEYDPEVDLAVFLLTGCEVLS